MASTSLGEREPLLDQPVNKPFYRARPLWLVPFAIAGSVVRGMTLAPRVEVYTQLACVSIYHNRPHPQQTSNYTALSALQPLPENSEDGFITISLPQQDTLDDPSPDDDPRKIPSLQCTSDPAVQKEAARIQTLLTTAMGLLSALTTGTWGRFSERHGRTLVLALSTLGLFLTDLAFILVATPGSPLAAHGHKLLIIAPIIEGLLGGFSTFQSTVNSYVSDCTSPGSRATIFSRFNGIFFLGFSVGPIIGGWIIAHGIPGISKIGTVTDEGESVTEVFWLAITLSFINFFLTTFLFPESLSKEKRAEAKRARRAEKLRSADPAVASVGEGSTESYRRVPRSRFRFIKRIFSPLKLFLPVIIYETTAAGVRKRRDWSLTFLGLAVFLYMLSTGVAQIRYLYAVHTYNWAADQLSYYISYIGGVQAIALLFLLPAVISAFKPKRPAGQGKHSKPSKAHLAGEINFDILLSRCCLFIEVLAQFLITVIAAPSQVHHTGASGLGDIRSWFTDPSTRLTALFVITTGFGTMGSGFLPACQSLALCIVQARQLLLDGEEDEAHSGTGIGSVRGEDDADMDSTAGPSEIERPKSRNTSVGNLFGALSIIQALGQMILGPMVFGFLYGDTVAFFPKAVFVVAGGILAAALVCAFLLRSPLERHLNSPVPSDGNGKKKSQLDLVRGRSRAGKGLFIDTTHRGFTVISAQDGNSPVARVFEA